MTAVASLPRASFAGIEFPYERLTVIGAIREHVHEYGHSPGGDPETLGRRLYTVRFECAFDEAHNLSFSGLYPAALDALFGLFETEAKAPLVVPNMGTVQAYCANWTREIQVAILSGETVGLEFHEDRSADFIFAKLAQKASRSLVPPLDITAQEVAAYKAAYGADAAPVGLFQALDNAVNGVLAIQDQVEMAGQLLDAKLTHVVDSAKALNQAIQDPKAFAVLDAIKDVWYAALQAKQDILTKQGSPLKYITPRDMPITAVSAAIFGTTGRSFEILNQNDVADPMDIPAGTPLVYFHAAA